MKKQHVQLTESDRAQLKELLRKGSLPVKTYRRAQALLALDQGQTYLAVAALVGVSNLTVATWSQKYCQVGLAMLPDQPRSGRPRTIDGLQRAQITALACSEPPAGYGQWSLRLLADQAVELGYVEQISHTQVSTILKKTR
jgi:putative transposase